MELGVAVALRQIHGAPSLLRSPGNHNHADGRNGLFVIADTTNNYPLISLVFQISPSIGSGRTTESKQNSRLHSPIPPTKMKSNHLPIWRIDA